MTGVRHNGSGPRLRTRVPTDALAPHDHRIVAYLPPAPRRIGLWLDESGLEMVAERGLSWLPIDRCNCDPEFPEFPEVDCVRWVRNTIGEASLSDLVTVAAELHDARVEIRDLNRAFIRLAEHVGIDDWVDLFDPWTPEELAKNDLPDNEDDLTEPSDLAAAPASGSDRAPGDTEHPLPSGAPTVQTPSNH